MPFLIINPFHPGKLVWDGFIFILILYLLITLPLFTLTTLQLSVDESNTFMIIDAIIDILFLIDIGIACSTTYADEYGD